MTAFPLVSLSGEYTNGRRPVHDLPGIDILTPEAMLPQVSSGTDTNPSGRAIVESEFQSQSLLDIDVAGSAVGVIYMHGSARQSDCVLRWFDIISRWHPELDMGKLRQTEVL